MMTPEERAEQVWVLLQSNRPVSGWTDADTRNAIAGFFRAAIQDERAEVAAWLEQEAEGHERVAKAEYARQGWDEAHRHASSGDTLRAAVLKLRSGTWRASAQGAGR